MEKLKLTRHPVLSSDSDIFVDGDGNDYVRFKNILHSCECHSCKYRTRSGYELLTDDPMNNPIFCFDCVEVIK